MGGVNAHGTRPAGGAPDSVAVAQTWALEALVELNDYLARGDAAWLEELHPARPERQPWDFSDTPSGCPTCLEPVPCRVRQHYGTLLKMASAEHVLINEARRQRARRLYRWLPWRR